MSEIQWLDEIATRYCALYWQGCVREYMTIGHDPTLTVDTMVEGETPDTYYWPDIDYADQSRSSWRAADHYNRLLRLLCQEGSERLSNDPRFRARVLGGVRYWVEKDYINPNWWHNDIGMPNHMTALALMLCDIMPEELLERVIALGARGSAKVKPAILQWTGANLIWGIGNTIRHALLTSDEELLMTAVERAQREITIGGVEGMQEDGGFCQHGPRWYSGGYGANFTFDIAQFIYILAGTPYAIPDEKVEMLLTHVLDGQRHMMHHGFFDYNGVGRELTRRGALRAKIIHYAVDLLSCIEDIPRREELLAFSEQNRAGLSSGVVPYATTRYYKSISYLAHNYGDIHMGIKCHAPGQYDMEVCNSEGYLCYNMSYGTRTCHMRRGDEYLDINPIYDYAHVPGTTARLEDDAALKTHVNWWSLPLPTDATCGLAEDGYGILTEQPEHDGVRATVSYFTFGGRMIALGAGIVDETPERGALTTTLDQCRVADPDLTEESFVSNGGFTYYNLDPATTLKAQITEREGSWQRNSYEEAYEKLTGELFLAYIPVECAHSTYAYAVCPRGETVDARVLCNDTNVQAVLTDDGVLMAAVHEAGTYNFSGAEISVSKPGCVIKYYSTDKGGKQ